MEKGVKWANRLVAFIVPAVRMQVGMNGTNIRSVVSGLPQETALGHVYCVFLIHLMVISNSLTIYGAADF